MGEWKEHEEPDLHGENWESADPQLKEVKSFKSRMRSAGSRVAEGWTQYDLSVGNEWVQFQGNDEGRTGMLWWKTEGEI